MTTTHPSNPSRPHAPRPVSETYYHVHDVKDELIVSATRTNTELYHLPAKVTRADIASWIYPIRNEGGIDIGNRILSESTPNALVDYAADVLTELGVEVDTEAINTKEFYNAREATKFLDLSL